MYKYIIPFLAAFILTFIQMPFTIKIAKKKGFLDVPKDERRVHKKPIPVGGGIAMVISVSILMVYFLPINKNLILTLIASLIIAISGLYDDKEGLSPKLKFLFQILAAVILIIGGMKIEFFTNPFDSHDALLILNILSIPVTIFWVCGITNTINLIDGLDGLASGVSMICAISMFFITYKMGRYDVSLVCALVAGACLGFLPFNFNPAKIFMGDTGALYLGFMLSYISISGFLKQAAILMIFVPVLILGVPVFDTAFAMVRRKLSGKSMVEADKGHLHHRLLKMGLNQRQTVVILYSISAIFGVLANLISRFHSSIALVISIGVLLIIIATGVAAGMLKNKEE
ncbi:MAG: MraY family glycosyltransferase [Peptoniphilus harei]|uniref:glycosyltransferase family 4 protein n=1 Tax=Peptoniphilus TaxID=162289 RepID=UPI002550976A|nr:MraY family glycosyltransferase [Peptoniphilus harei]MDK7755623.1 MraY family glycosyltransferase [Peptoniphilus harei]MDK7761322.1 MraY family glycosyltransferase [Peptoniphilus harei]MDK8271305.1 MraY family glycosyltransferase [Peptoniphilus harei]MDK8339825.1 MraY family glycosyltransferase [Peptoniphilus harei]MDU7533128.1 MraY family glycosyltransferase [Peptoniphilus harei]